MLIGCCHCDGKKERQSSSEISSEVPSEESSVIQSESSEEPSASSDTGGWFCFSYLCGSVLYRGCSI